MRKDPPATTPSAVHKLVDLGFIDARSKTLDIAAFLDRIDRHGGSSDFRLAALRAALAELGSSSPNRARRILEQLSDPSREPALQASAQAACGAPPPLPERES
jgi:hypothetical protein